MKTIALDVFTRKLLEVYSDLVKRGAIGKKIQFARIILLTPGNFYNIETHARNYPEDKQPACKTALLEKFGVNPEYLTGRSTKMYVREPESAYKKMDKITSLNFDNKAQKESILNELQQFKDLYYAEHAKVQKLEEELKEYKKSDKKPDKKAGNG